MSTAESDTQNGKSSTLTPLMKQYYDAKAKVSDALLFFRMGDFYELFADDAIIASKVLEITLTSRDKNKENPVAMAGVPHHSASGYIQRLLKEGYKVAIAEQIDASGNIMQSGKGNTKGIVHRDVVRVFTPAVQFDVEGINSFSQNSYNYLSVILPCQNEKKFIWAGIDASTGDVRYSDVFSEGEFESIFSRIPSKHWLIKDGFAPKKLANQSQVQIGNDKKLIETLPSNFFSFEQAEALLKENYQSLAIQTFLKHPEQTQALGIALYYILKTQKLTKLSTLKFPQPIFESQCLQLSGQAIEHLDLLPQSDGTPSLFEQIPSPGTSAGMRKLKDWLLQPLCNLSEIEKRQESVKNLASHKRLRQELRNHFKEMYDLNRILSRVQTKLANPRDTYALGKTLAKVPQILSSILNHPKPQLIHEIYGVLEKANTHITPLYQYILKAQKPNAPLVARDGDVFELGVNVELDRLIALNTDGQKFLLELEASEREKTGISTLKIRYNRVFGYYIEVTSTHLKNVPSHYLRKQTTVGGERFFTEELKKFEEEMVSAETKQKALEISLFEDLLKKIDEVTSVVMSVSEQLSALDALSAMAELSENHGYVFPTLNNSLELKLKASRHPMVDATTQGKFVANDIEFCPETARTLLITGPNMGGKSTLMRQTALIIILGQMGAPVPAQSAEWGVFDSIHTRIGAHDAIAKGQSTFMVEMSELAQIIHTATERSLIILDEIGRGTSTYDGMSVAWATLEYLCQNIRARTLFATHYHELTHLEGKIATLLNAHMAVEKKGDQLQFLYRLKIGPTNESFGIQVAKMAGIPEVITNRAFHILKELDSPSPMKDNHSEQLALFSLSHFPSSPNTHDQLKKENEKLTLKIENQAKEIQKMKDFTRQLTELNINDTTPVQALTKLSELQNYFSYKEGNSQKT